MFEDPEDINDRVADLFSSNDPSQQIQTGSDFESEPELESVLSSLWMNASDWKSSLCCSHNATYVLNKIMFIM